MFPTQYFRKGAAALLFVLAACSVSNTIKVTDRNFGDEIETRQNLVFKFEDQMVPDSLINLWDSTAYIKIAAEIKGLFKWT